MEKNFYTDNFERLLKEKSDEFRMYPSRRVWHSIYNDLHPSRRWPSIAMSMVLMVMLVFIGYLNTSDNIAGNKRASGNDQPETISAAGPESMSGQPVSLSANNDGRSSLDDYNGSSLQNDNTASGTITGQFSGPDKSDLTSSPVNDLASTTSGLQNNAKSRNNSGSISSNLPAEGSSNVVAEMDNYIQSGQLIADVVSGKKNKTTANNTTDRTSTGNKGDESMANSDPVKGLVSTPDNALSNVLNAANGNNVKEKEKAAAKKAGPSLSDKTDPNEEKSWIEDYAFHNKSARKAWKDRMSYEIYATPSVGYRGIVNTSNPEQVVTSLTANPTTSPNVKGAVNQKPSLGLEAGIGLSYSFARKFRLKAGVQLNYTNYGIKADQTNHPILTTLSLNNLNTGYSYLETRTSSLSNNSGVKPVTVHNRTYQVSIPVGLAVKLAGNNKMEWFVGGTVQPTYVMGGKAYLISSDYQNYVQESSMMRKWNMNTSVETYINYKLGSYSLQVGPQFRYQVMSTYNKKYTIKENLYNAGLKLGIIKGF